MRSPSKRWETEAQRYLGQKYTLTWIPNLKCLWVELLGALQNVKSCSLMVSFYFRYEWKIFRTESKVFITGLTVDLPTSHWLPRDLWQWEAASFQSATKPTCVPGRPTSGLWSRAWGWSKFFIQAHEGLLPHGDLELLLIIACLQHNIIPWIYDSFTAEMSL